MRQRLPLISFWKLSLPGALSHPRTSQDLDSIKHHEVKYFLTICKV